jgi:uroporphyrinogen decarboxylase
MYALSEKENLIHALTRRSPDYVPVRRLDGRIPGMTEILYRGSQAPLSGTDRWGVTWAGGAPAGNEWEPEIASYPVAHPLQDLSILDDYPFPDPYEPGIMDGLLDDVDQDQVLVSGKLFFLLLERAHLLVGMENLFLAMIDQPDKVRHLLSRIADHQIGIVHRYLDLEVDIIRATDDYGAQRSLLLSPELWRSLIKPELSRIITAAKEGGALFWLHSCGHIMEILPDLIEIGVDVVDPVQANANDQAEFKRSYGDKLCFMGGIDTQHTLTLGSLKEIAAEVEKRIQLMGPGGGFILAPDTLIPVPEANYRAYLEAGARYGRYPLGRTDGNRGGSYGSQ